MNRNVYIVTGKQGVGKSTIIKSLLPKNEGVHFPSEYPDKNVIFSNANVVFEDFKVIEVLKLLSEKPSQARPCFSGKVIEAKFPKNIFLEGSGKATKGEIKAFLTFGYRVHKIHIKA